MAGTLPVLDGGVIVLTDDLSSPEETTYSTGQSWTGMFECMYSR